MLCCCRLSRSWAAACDHVTIVSKTKDHPIETGHWKKAWDIHTHNRATQQVPHRYVIGSVLLSIRTARLSNLSPEREAFGAGCLVCGLQLQALCMQPVNGSQENRGAAAPQIG